jgi:hypothetical protein
MSSAIVVPFFPGDGWYRPEPVRELITKAEEGATVTHTARQAAPQQQAVQKPAPARTPRPLGPKSRAFIAEINRQEAERAANVQKAVHAALALTEPPQPKPTVRKSKDDPDKALVAVYTSDGTLCGVVAQGKITYLAQPPTPASASQPASGTAQDSGPRQAPPTQAQQAGPAAAAAANPVADPSQPGTLPAGPNQLADDQDQDPTTAAVVKALREGRLDGLAAQLRKQAADGSPREKRDAFDALNTLALLAFGELRTTGGRRIA